MYVDVDIGANIQTFREVVQLCLVFAAFLYARQNHVYVADKFIVACGWWKYLTGFIRLHTVLFVVRYRAV